MSRRSYSDTERETTLSVAVRTTTEVVETNLNFPCSAMEVPRRRTARLSDSSDINTFPEKNIRKEILNTLAKKGDAYYITIPHDWENLVAVENLAWFRWYISKLDQVKQQKEAKRSLESRKREEVDEEREQRLRKQQLDKENLRVWLERKVREDAARKEENRRLELEKQKKVLEKERIEKVAKKAQIEWNKKKDSERRAQKQKEEQIRQQKEEEKRLRVQKNKEAFEAWVEKTKNRPKPMSIAIKDRKGTSDPILAQLNWNPVPWRNVVDDINIPKDQEMKKKFMKPSSI